MGGSRKKLPRVTPEKVMEAIAGAQRSAAIKAGVELGVFGFIGKGTRTVKAIAAHCDASGRGIRILCDALAVMGFLEKSRSGYRLSPEGAAYLDPASPTYLGDTTYFLLSEEIKRAIDNLTDAVRRGGVAYSAEGNIAEENPVWVEFARSMMGLQRRPAELLVELVERDRREPLRILDVAAGHGLYGIAMARRFPAARITALDWAPVLKLARENARQAGVHDRYHLIAGDAFTVELGGPYDVVLLPNFLHHFSPARCTAFLKRIHRVLRDDGRVITFEQVPGEDRRGPTPSINFALMMLATTPEGDAYTLSEYRRMFRDAGFPRTELHELPGLFGRGLVSRKQR